MITVAMAGAVFAGALMQRLSGVGFALITAPLLVLATNAHQGIRLANLLTIFVSLSVLATSAAHVDRSRAKLLAPAGLLGVVPGVILARTVPADRLQIIIGTLIAVSLLAVIVVRRLRIRSTSARSASAGFASGFTNAAAGVGGPALTVYAIAIDWPQEAFAATGQISFAVQSAASLAIGGPPYLNTSLLTILLCATASGLTAGQVGSKYVRSGTARHVAIMMAALGTLATLLKGLAL